MDEAEQEEAKDGEKEWEQMRVEGWEGRKKGAAVRSVTRR